MTLPTLDSISVKNKTVLVRADFNVPVADGRVLETQRIESTLDTIRALRDRGARVTLMTHFGRPGGKPDDPYRLDPIAAELARQLQSPVVKFEVVAGPRVAARIRTGRPAEVSLLENLRFDPREEADDESFAQELAAIADAYVNEAFSVCHRAHASVSAITRFLPSAAGLSLQREVNSLTRLKDCPQTPYSVILGGKKISDKIGLLKALLPKASALFLGGGMANTFLAAQGFILGQSFVEADALDTARAIIKQAAGRGVAVHLPSDLKAWDDSTNCVLGDFAIGEFPPNAAAMDIGPRTIAAYQAALLPSKTVFFNGPLGVFENPAFKTGTFAVLQSVAVLDAFKVAGGGETVAALADAGVTSQFTFVSTGGGAALAFLAGEPMPGLDALLAGVHA
ncbi:MAG: phosphoglycerate kinase [bacterium]